MQGIVPDAVCKAVWPMLHARQCARCVMGEMAREGANVCTDVNVVEPIAVWLSAGGGGLHAYGSVGKAQEKARGGRGKPLCMCAPLCALWWLWRTNVICRVHYDRVVVYAYTYGSHRA